jgi:hypothetical protein
MFVGKARGLPKSGAPEMLERLATDKHSKLLRKSGKGFIGFTPGDCTKGVHAKPLLAT